MKIFLLLLLWFNLFAQNDYSLRFAYGKASESDLGKIIFGDFLNNQQNGFSVLALDAGYKLYRSDNNAWSIYAKTGLANFHDKGIGHIYESTLYFKAYYTFFKFMRLGAGEGLSYTSGILQTEYLEAQRNHGKNSKFLNYLDFNLDFNIGSLIPYSFFDELYVGWSLKHRSGVYGLINNVKHGGSNYNAISIEKNF